MNTKEAIKVLNGFRYTAGDYIIDLIRELEKYEQMWGEFDELYGHFDIIPLGTSYRIYELMERLKQKYFPKEVK